ncbi:urea ABC transporter permease subunit UrtB [Roseospira navarrensis]|uniref:Urea ABC transporter permease subunit UrtB n=1 Tax=Roseospira navarrensis TaxID=140058 RepID=A0A7X2D519_9PROT|nr:urea ABC transporter permease subunit UrtB [Roseospira navarrensis]MQX38421.1 urea ABC transporter permease subunit UrtB [Roseospira navarrensis]
MTRLRRFLLAALLMCVAPSAAIADEARLREIAAGFVDANFSAIAETAEALAATGDPDAAIVLQELRDGDLHWRKDDETLVIAERDRRDMHLFHLFTGEPLETVRRRDVSKVKVNNAIRNQVDALIGGLTLLSPDPEARRSAAEALYDTRDPALLGPMEAAMAQETDPALRTLMAEARAAILLADAGAPLDARLEAVRTIEARGGQDALSTLAAAVPDDGPADLLAAAAEARAAVEARLELWGYAQNVWQGLSLGSVLLLAAIGLAITFGVMGVINMAHGELVMLGAYTTFFVQEIIRTSAPGLFEWSLLIALPLAFLVSGSVGVLIERGVVRWLYGRPLETLLATWGISLILQQTVRTIFGPNNREVGNPDWMSGAMQLGELTITYNRLWIIVFALTVFALLLVVLRRTPIGLQMRAVTQNRAMAADMGVRTGWVDAMTFGLGAGVAGLAGVALSQIDNVSPNLGQSYIVDSFMVVVFGGAGNLWGALAGAFTLGIANKFLEPFAGAVLAKILVLVFIILFIQKRPRGLFAVRGRAVEA